MIRSLVVMVIIVLGIYKANELLYSFVCWLTKKPPSNGDL